jgi:hypothetical protein
MGDKIASAKKLISLANSTPSPRPASIAKYSSFLLSEIMIEYSHPVSIRGALRGRHER